MLCPVRLAITPVTTSTRNSALRQLAKRQALAQLRAIAPTHVFLTSFQQALDRVRFEMAMMYLENPGLSLSEIGLLLAFSEQSAFCRAFRRWSGQTPRAFRDALQRRPPPARA